MMERIGSEFDNKNLSGRMRLTGICSEKSTMPLCVALGKSISAIVSGPPRNLNASLPLDNSTALATNPLLKAIISGCDPGKNDAQLSAASLQVNLVEPHPDNKQFFTILDDPGSAGLAIACSKPITIDWGDGSYSYLESSDDLTHNYLTAGTYCITIWGNMDGITGIATTNCTGTDALYHGGVVGQGYWDDNAKWDDEAPWIDNS